VEAILEKQRVRSISVTERGPWESAPRHPAYSHTRSKTERIKKSSTASMPPTRLSAESKSPALIPRQTANGTRTGAEAAPRSPLARTSSAPLRGTQTPMSAPPTELPRLVEADDEGDAVCPPPEPEVASDWRTHRQRGSLD